MKNQSGVLIERRTADRRTGSHEMISHLVNERTQLLSLYGELASLHPFKEDDAVMDVLEKFCQSLIDYTADAHFRLYRFIDERKERRSKVLEVANEVYPQIVSTTNTILNFNDKYDAREHKLNITSLEDDLSLLGERLADRIDMEDEIIKVLKASRMN